MARLAKASKMLAYILRHRPDTIGISLDKEGWASVEELVAKTAHRADIQLTEALIRMVVSTDEKGRYELSEDGDEIRAVQGHSSEQVDLTFEVSTPPDFLYHGTSSTNEESIKRLGLQSMNRHYVHLTTEQTVAAKVGSRHGTPFVFVVHCKGMIEAGYTFKLANNGVWLIENVPPAFLTAY